MGGADEMCAGGMNECREGMGVRCDLLQFKVLAQGLGPVLMRSRWRV